VEDFARKL